MACGTRYARGRAMNHRISDDPRNLARERELWDWVRAAGVSAEALSDMLLAGPADAPRRRAGEEIRGQARNPGSGSQAA